MGSFNFGVVPHMGIPGMYLQTHNRNVLSSRAEREELRRFLWRRLRPQLEAVVPGWRIWKKHYLRQCRDIPPLTVDGEALPWNGEQLNAFHAAVRHRDRHDARWVPCLIAFCGSLPFQFKDLKIQKEIYTQFGQFLDEDELLTFAVYTTGVLNLSYSTMKSRLMAIRAHHLGAGCKDPLMGTDEYYEARAPRGCRTGLP